MDPNQCATCQGTGLLQIGNNVQACPMCDGTGSYTPGLQYTYAATVALAANAVNIPLIINIYNNDFKWIFATSIQTGAFTIQIGDGSSAQRQFFNNPLHYSLVFGTGQNPFPLITPYVFKKRGSIVMALNDLSGAPNTVWVGFIGVELVPSATQTGKVSSAAGSASSSGSMAGMYR